MKKIILILFIIFNSLVAQIAINQVGYLPQSIKFAYFNSKVNSFKIVDAEAGKVVFSGDCKLWKKNDPASGETVYRGDFSQFSEEGTYYIVDNNGRKSAPFTIASGVYDDLYQKSVKSFYIQRCGVPLDEKYAGKFAHPICHTQDGIYHNSAGKTGHKDVTGGWHDAGDYGKYIVNGAYSVAVMLTGYELYPAGFRSDNLNIPESGNGIPDYLDECRFELEWFLTMQDDDGGLYHKVTAANFSAMETKPQNHDDPRLIIQKTSTATADFAAVMAKAARIYRQYDKDFSEACRTAALNAWTYLENNPKIIPKGGYQNPRDINTGSYGDRNDRDERLWAAVELYITSGDEKFNRFYQANIGRIPEFDELFSWNSVQNLAHVNYLLLADDANTEKTKQSIQKEFKKYCETLKAKCNNSGYRVLLDAGDYQWGSCQMALNSGFMMLIGAEIFNEDDYHTVAMDQLHFNLGVNALHTTFVTGFGTQYPKSVHNRICSLTDDWSIFPGFLVGGPNENLQDPALQKAFDKKTPPAKCYVDVMESYASNETCINWNAILAVYAGYLKGMKQ